MAADELRLELEFAPCPRDIHNGNWTQLPLAKLTHSRGITILMKGVMIHSRSTPTENNISLDVSIDKSLEGVWLWQMRMFAWSWWLATNLNCILACDHFNQPTILIHPSLFQLDVFMCSGHGHFKWWPASWHWAALRHISDILEHNAARSPHILDSIQKDSNIIWNGWTNAWNSNNNGLCRWELRVLRPGTTAGTPWDNEQMGGTPSWLRCTDQANVHSNHGLWVTMVLSLQTDGQVITITVLTKIIGHVAHFRWPGPNVWCEISQIWIEYIKPMRQMSDEPRKFFSYTAIDGLGRDQSGDGLSQWEKALLCNAFSHWRSPYPEWSLFRFFPAIIQCYNPRHPRSDQ